MLRSFFLLSPNRETPFGPSLRMTKKLKSDRFDNRIRFIQIELERNETNERIGRQAGELESRGLSGKAKVYNLTTHKKALIMVVIVSFWCVLLVWVGVFI